MPLSTIKGTGWGSHHILMQITSEGTAKPDERDRCLGTAAVLRSHTCHAKHGVFTRKTKSPTLEPSTTHSTGCPDKPSLDWPSCPFLPSGIPSSYKQLKQTSGLTLELRTSRLHQSILISTLQKKELCSEQPRDLTKGT